MRSEREKGDLGGKAVEKETFWSIEAESKRKDSQRERN